MHDHTVRPTQLVLHRLLTGAFDHPCQNFGGHPRGNFPHLQDALMLQGPMSSVHVQMTSVTLKWQSCPAHAPLGGHECSEPEPEPGGSALYLARALRALEGNPDGAEEDILWKQIVITAPCTEDNLGPDHLGEEFPFSSGLGMHDHTVRPTQLVLHRLLTGAFDHPCQNFGGHPRGNFPHLQDALMLQGPMSSVHVQMTSVTLKWQSCPAHAPLGGHECSEPEPEPGGSALYLARALRALEGNPDGAEEDILWKQIVITAPCTEDNLGPDHLGEEFPFSSGLGMHDHTVRPTQLVLHRLLTGAFDHPCQNFGGHPRGNFPHLQDALMLQGPMSSVHVQMTSVTLKWQSCPAHAPLGGHECSEPEPEPGGSALYLARALRALEGNPDGAEEDILWKQIVITAPCTEDNLGPDHLGEEFPFSSGLGMHDHTVRPTQLVLHRLLTGAFDHPCQNFGGHPRGNFPHLQDALMLQGPMSSVHVQMTSVTLKWQSCPAHAPLGGHECSEPEPEPGGSALYLARALRALEGNPDGAEEDILWKQIVITAPCTEDNLGPDHLGEEFPFSSGLGMHDHTVRPTQLVLHRLLTGAFDHPCQNFGGHPRGNFPHLQDALMLQGPMSSVHVQMTSVTLKWQSCPAHAPLGGHECSEPEPEPGGSALYLARALRALEGNPDGAEEDILWKQIVITAPCTEDNLGPDHLGEEFPFSSGLGMHDHTVRPTQLILHRLLTGAFDHPCQNFGGHPRGNFPHLQDALMLQGPMSSVHVQMTSVTLKWQSCPAHAPLGGHECSEPEPEPGGSALYLARALRALEGNPDGAEEDILWKQIVITAPCTEDNLGPDHLGEEFPFSSGLGMHDHTVRPTQLVLHRLLTGAFDHPCQNFGGHPRAKFPQCLDPLILQCLNTFMAPAPATAPAQDGLEPLPFSDVRLGLEFEEASWCIRGTPTLSFHFVSVSEMLACIPLWPEVELDTAPFQAPTSQSPGEPSKEQEKSLPEDQGLAVCLYLGPAQEKEPSFPPPEQVILFFVITFSLMFFIFHCHIYFFFLGMY
nr:uncharacterized protein LOC131278085 isoform X3 [Dasypus novemcinctus]XP_058150852.1 uncharacterized protein LOC131278085 isoform X3 [Dasypus novemcinctus]